MDVSGFPAVIPAPIPPDPMLDRLRLATAGEYDIAGELGRGGMAVVYLGKDLALDRLVAIKVMDPRLALTPGMAERFLLEARIAARLQHPNIIVVHDIRQAHELTFFVMSFIEGAAADDLLRRPNPMAIDEARWLLALSARALVHAHGEGIVHRDVKPANILVTLKGDVVLTDFGIAKAAGGTSLTKSGTQVGTPAYMSPEQFTEQPVGPASDQYSLGITAYQMLTGHLPFNGELYQLIVAHTSEEPVPIRDRRPDCPAYLANAVMRMLAKDPARRWPSLADVADVCAANLPADGGQARRALASAAQTVHAERVQRVPALQSRTPSSPIPVSRTPAPATPAPRVVTLSPAGATILVGTTIEFRASVSDGGSLSRSSESMLWHSSDPSIARVGSDGQVHALSPGAVSITVRVGAAVAVAQLTVEAAPLARIEVVPPQLTVLVGDEVVVPVTVYDVTGRIRNDARPTLESATPPDTSPVVIGESIDGSLKFRAVRAGEGMLRLVAGNCETHVPVLVLSRPAVSVAVRTEMPSLEIGAAAVLQVDARDDLGNPVNTAVSWESSAPGIVHVDRDGIALAIAPGQARVRAIVDGAAGLIELAVVEPPIAFLSFPAPVIELEVGDQCPLPLTTRDASGAPRSSADVEVRVDREDVLRVDAASLRLEALAAGDVRLIAAPRGSFEGGQSPVVRATCVVRIRAAQAVALELSSDELRLDVGQSATVSGVVTDERGRPVPGAILEWYAPPDGVLRIESAGAQAACVRAMSDGEAILRVACTNPDGSVVTRTLPVFVTEHASVPRVDRASSASVKAPTPQTTAASTADPSTSRPPGAAATSPYRGRVVAIGIGVCLVAAVVWRWGSWSEQTTSVVQDQAGGLNSSRDDTSTVSAPPVASSQSVSTPQTGRDQPSMPSATRLPTPSSTPSTTTSSAPSTTPSTTQPTPQRATVSEPSVMSGRVPDAPASQRLATRDTQPRSLDTAARPIPALPATPLPIVQSATPPAPNRSIDTPAVTTPPSRVEELAPPSLSELQATVDEILASLRANPRVGGPVIVEFYRTGEAHQLQGQSTVRVVDGRSPVRAQVEVLLRKNDNAGRAYRATSLLTFTAERRADGNVRFVVLGMTPPTRAR